MTTTIKKGKRTFWFPALSALGMIGSAYLPSDAVFVNRDVLRSLMLRLLSEWSAAGIRPTWALYVMPSIVFLVLGVALAAWFLSREKARQRVRITAASVLAITIPLVFFVTRDLVLSIPAVTFALGGIVGAALDNRLSRQDVTR